MTEVIQINHIEELQTALQDVSTVYLAPFCNATRRLKGWLETIAPHVVVRGFLDSYKSIPEEQVWRISELENPESIPVITALDRPHIRQQVIAAVKRRTECRIIEVESLELTAKEDRDPENEVFYHIYDLRKLACNYEFFYSLVLAEHQRRQTQANHLMTLFITNDQTNLLYQFDRTTSVASRKGGLETDQNWFLNQVLVPGLQLLPSSCGYQQLTEAEARLALKDVKTSLIFNPSNEPWSNKEPAYHVFDIGKQENLCILEAPTGARLAVKQWLSERGLAPSSTIAITLREASYSTERNSDLHAWREAALEYIDIGMNVVYIRDTFTAFDEPIDFPGLEFEAGPWNLALRLALHESALASFSVNTGPACGIAALSRRSRLGLFVHQDTSMRAYETSTEYNEQNVKGIRDLMRSGVNNTRVFWGNAADAKYIIECSLSLIDELQLLPQRPQNRSF